MRYVSWDVDIHDDALRISAGDDLDIVREEVLSGEASLIECNDGFLVVRSEISGKEETLVLVLGEGRGLVKSVVALIESAKTDGFKKIRTHTNNKALASMYIKQGFEVEYVLTKRVS